jgi:hypothetical protein
MDAALAMNQDLGFTPWIFGAGAGIFFIGYLLFEVPSNLALQHFGARVWIARIMVSWGLVAMAMALVSGTASFYAMRFPRRRRGRLLPGTRARASSRCSWRPCRSQRLLAVRCPARYSSCTDSAG